MKFKFLIPALFSCSISFCLPSISGMPGMEGGYDQNYPENLVINNRILLKVNGKTVTVMDVVKKMDILFYRQFPDLKESNLARFQFYSAAWRNVLAAVVDDALIMADAKEKEVVISDGEVREELEKLFGPDVVINIDKLGMSLEEAFELLKTELIVQRMNGMMVRSKAMTEVHPKLVRERYEKMMHDSPPQSTWVYQVLSVKGDDHERVAEEAHRLIAEQKIPFESVIEHLQTEGATLSLSEEYSRDERSLALAHKAILKTLSAGMCSAPTTKENISRLFYLKRFEEGHLAMFNEVAEKYRAELMQESMARHNKIYREKLRAHYGLTEDYLSSMVPEKLEPFAMK